MKQKVKKEEMTGFHAPPPAKKAETASRGVTEAIQLQSEMHFKPSTVAQGSSPAFPLTSLSAHALASLCVWGILN